MGEGTAGRGLGWEAVIPVRIRAVEEPGDQDFQRGINIRLLRVLTAPEDSASGDEADDRVRHRLEAKVDLLLVTMAQQAWSSVGRQEVVLSRDGIRVEIGESNARGELRDIELWLAAEQPQPLYLRGLISGEPDAQGRDFLAFEGLSEEEIELLERFLFQQHRRAVAAARRRQG